MNIALDYDGTYDQHPPFWEEFITLARAQGHDIRCVTKRYPETGAPKITVPVIFSCGRAKRRAALEAGFKVDVWIAAVSENIFVADGEDMEIKSNAHT